LADVRGVKLKYLVFFSSELCFIVNYYFFDVQVEEREELQVGLELEVEVELELEL
jgi:hypothetical protein